MHCSSYKQQFKNFQLLGSNASMTLRIAALDSEDEGKTPNYDKEKYREMILDAAETVLGPFGFDRTLYGDSKKRRGKWWQELVKERKKDIETEMTGGIL